MNVSVSFSDILAALALVLSLIATITTIRFNGRQKFLIDSQELLNQKLLAREENDARVGAQADLSANLVKVGKHGWRLKIYNRGRVAARNVTIECAETDGLFIQSEINSKFPLESLEPAHGVELIASVHMGSQSKHRVTLRWSDDLRDSNEKTVYVTL